MDWNTEKIPTETARKAPVIDKTPLQTHALSKQKLFFSSRIISLHHVEASGVFEAELLFSTLYVTVIMIRKALSFNFCVEKALQGSADIKGSNTYTVRVCARFHSCYNM